MRVETEHNESGSSNSGDGEEYKNEKYWLLPENVRHAIDLSK